jgi:hypothetical protein
MRAKQETPTDRRGARRKRAVAMDRRRSTPYCAGIGPTRGLLLYNEALLAIGVRKTASTRKAIGVAYCVGEDDLGAALWRLTIGRDRLPGRWIVIDGEFRRGPFRRQEKGPMN